MTHAERRIKERFGWDKSDLVALRHRIDQGRTSLYKRHPDGIEVHALYYKKVSIHVVYNPRKKFILTVYSPTSRRKYP